MLCLYLKILTRIIETILSNLINNLCLELLKSTYKINSCHHLNDNKHGNTIASYPIVACGSVVRISCGILIAAN